MITGGKPPLVSEFSMNDKIEKLRKRAKLLARRLNQQRKQAEEDARLDSIDRERRNLIQKKLRIIVGAERYDHQLHSRLFTKY